MPNVGQAYRKSLMVHYDIFWAVTLPFSFKYVLRTDTQSLALSRKITHVKHGSREY